MRVITKLLPLTLCFSFLTTGYSQNGGNDGSSGLNGISSIITSLTELSANISADGTPNGNEISSVQSLSSHGNGGDDGVNSEISSVQSLSSNNRKITSVNNSIQSLSHANKKEIKTELEEIITTLKKMKKGGEEMDQHSFDGIIATLQGLSSSLKRNSLADRMSAMKAGTAIQTVSNDNPNATSVNSIQDLSTNGNNGESEINGQISSVQSLSSKGGNDSGINDEISSISSRNAEIANSLDNLINSIQNVAGNYHSK